MAQKSCLTHTVLVDSAATALRSRLEDLVQQNVFSQASAIQSSVLALSKFAGRGMSIDINTTVNVCVSLSLSLYIYIYIYIYTL